MELKQYLEAIDSKQERICRPSDEIWGYAETAFSERGRKCRLLQFRPFSP